MFDLFNVNTTIWICGCCQYRAWINADAFSNNKEYSCLVCGHISPLAYHPKQKEKEEE